MRKFSMEIKFCLPVQITKKKKWYLASCCPMDVHTQGETEKIALKNIEEALRMFLISCLERHTFDEVMKECGIGVEKSVKCHPTRNEKYVDVQIPVYLNSNQTKRCVCHA